MSGSRAHLKDHHPPALPAPGTLACLSAKGGVGKSSLASSLAGLLNAAGRTVCIVDFDTQPAIAALMGLDPDLDDDGAALFAALCDPDGRTLEPITDLTVEIDGTTFERDGLAVVCGGQRFQHLGAICADGTTTGADGLPEAVYHDVDVLRLRTVLAKLAERYDYVIVDCSPGESFMQRMALAAVQFVIIPTRGDDNSIEAVATVAQRFVDVRPLNPQLALLGICLFAVGSGSSALRRTAREAVGDVLGNDDVVFDAFIRDVEAPSNLCRSLGILPNELEVLATKSPSKWPRTASALADDYERLAFEVMARRRKVLADIADGVVAGAA